MVGERIEGEKIRSLEGEKIRSLEGEKIRSLEGEKVICRFLPRKTVLAVGKMQKIGI
jgi:hypothetical protein